MLPGGNAVIATMLTMCQCRLYDAVIATMLTMCQCRLYDAVIATMLTMGQCRLYDAARRQCCPRDNADPRVGGIPANMTQVGQHIFLLYVDACVKLFISRQSERPNTFISKW